MSTISEFYNNPDLEDGFNSTTNRPNAHYGLDFAKPANTPIPAITAGHIVISEKSIALGNIAEVLGDDGRYYGYRHMINAGLAVGKRVEAGGTIGYVGNTGTASRGNHLCTTNASVRGGVYGTRYCVDPWPYIVKAIGANTASSGGSSTITNTREQDQYMWNFIGGAGDREGVWIAGPKGSKQLSGQEFDLLKRMRLIGVTVDANGNSQLTGSANMNAAEMNIVSNALAQVC